jgi:hypothetical protein
MVKGSTLTCGIKRKSQMNKTLIGEILFGRPVLLGLAIALLPMPVMVTLLLSRLVLVVYHDAKKTPTPRMAPTASLL